jgi:hypothetical protein
VRRHSVDPLTPALSGGEQFVMGVDLLDQAEPESLVGVDVSAANVEGDRCLVAEAAGQ